MKKNYQKYVLLIFAVVMFAVIILPAAAQNVKPQTTIVNLNAKGKSLATVFKDIENQTGYKFNYDQSEVDLKQLVTLSSKNTLRETLDAIASQIGLDFGISGSNISVRKADKKIAPQVRLISGVVTEGKTNLPIPGVNVFKKGTRQGAVTNASGEFTLRLVGDNLENTVVEFIYIGMKPKEVSLGKQTFLKIELDDDVATATNG